jgi:DNA-binding IclR family transcriptional regulator
MPERSESAAAVERPRQLSVQSVDRACAVLEHLAKSNAPRSALEVAQAIELHRTIVHRLLRTLLGHGMVEEERSGRYTLGARALTMGFEYLDGIAIRKIALPYLVDLSTRIVKRRPWAVTLGIPVDRSVVLVERIWNPNVVALTSLIDIGVRLPLDRSAAGWSVLAFCERPQVVELVGADRFEQIEDTLERVRRAHGLAFALGELRPGIGAISAPIFESEGRPVAVAIVAGSQIESELREDSEVAHELRRLVDHVSETARAAS